MMKYIVKIDSAHFKYSYYNLLLYNLCHETLSIVGNYHIKPACKTEV